MLNKLFVTLSLLCLLNVLTVSGAISSVMAADASEAEIQIELARAEVILSYEATARAEAAGANVSALLEALNQAGLFLSEAELAYAQERYDTALGSADQSISKLDGISDEAARLEAVALDARAMDFMVNVVGSVLATVCVVAGSFVLWQLLKKRRLPGSAQPVQTN